MRIDSDCWVSAAEFYQQSNKVKNVVLVRCNFLILDWKKSKLDYVPLPSLGRKLVLDRCRQLGLPEPEIIDTKDGGLVLKWHWRNQMERDVLSMSNFYGYKFNVEWDKMQKALYEAFEYLGADKRKLSAVTVFRVPGTVNTKIKRGDKFVRVINEGCVIDSYKDMQKVLANLDKDALNQPPVPSKKPKNAKPKPKKRKRRIKSISEEAVSNEISENKLETENNSTIDTANKKTKKTADKFSKLPEKYVGAWEADALKIHTLLSDRYICISQIIDGKWRNTWIQAQKLRDKLANLALSGDLLKYDTYISQLEFFSKSRKTNNVSSIGLNFLDLDGKIIGDANRTPDEWKQVIEEHCEKYEIPLPNIMMFSGGGVHLKWIYKEHVSRTNIEEWNCIQKLLLSQFTALGADSSSIDGSRVLRLVGSINHKKGVLDNETRVYKISDTAFTFENMFDILSKSQPVNPEEFNVCVENWEKCREKNKLAEANVIKPTDHEIEVNDYIAELQEFNQADRYWILNTLNHHRQRATWLRFENTDGQAKWIATEDLHKTLKAIYKTPNLKLSISEFKERDDSKPVITHIPFNYVVLSRCPGNTFEEKLSNIQKRCNVFREKGIPEANQVITVGETLIVEWSYIGFLPGYALSRWEVTQEFLCHHFEDWGAMDNPEYLKATAALPIPGFVYNGETAKLEYYSAEKKYNFGTLATAVLNFNQNQVREYKAEKATRKALHDSFKILLDEENRQKILSKKSALIYRKGSGTFAAIAGKRFMDIVKLLEMRRLNGGEVIEGHRELCVFWAMVSAIQAGTIENGADFDKKLEHLVNLCGEHFVAESDYALWGTLREKFVSGDKICYKATTKHLIETLGVTSGEEENLNVITLRVKKSGKQRQKREDWLAEHNIERTKPWEAEGISRRTWYKRKKLASLEKVKGQKEVKKTAFFMIKVIKPVVKRFLYMSRAEKKRVCTGVLYIIRRVLLLGGLKLFFILFFRKSRKKRRKARKKKKKKEKVFYFSFGEIRSVKKKTLRFFDAKFRDSV